MPLSDNSWEIVTKSAFEWERNALSFICERLPDEDLYCAWSGRFIYYAIDWPKTAKLIRFMAEDCCADLHKTLGASADHVASANRKK